MSNVEASLSKTAAEPLTWHDISDEKQRTYHFGNGKTYTVYNPLKLNVKTKPAGDSHRVVSEGGMGHYIPAGWVGISWLVHEGKPTVAF